MKLFVIITSTVVTLYLIGSCLLVLNIHEKIEISKVGKSGYVEYDGESFKSPESLKVAILQGQYQKLFWDGFLDMPTLILQIILGFLMGVFGGILKIMYEFNIKDNEPGVYAVFFSGIMGVFAFLIMLAFPEMLASNEIVVSNYVIAILSLFVGFIPRESFELIRNKIQLILGVK